MIRAPRSRTDSNDSRSASRTDSNDSRSAVPNWLKWFALRGPELTQMIRAPRPELTQMIRAPRSRTDRLKWFALRGPERTDSNDSRYAVPNWLKWFALRGPELTQMIRAPRSRTDSNDSRSAVPNWLKWFALRVPNCKYQYLHSHSGKVDRVMLHSEGDFVFLKANVHPSQSSSPTHSARVLISKQGSVETTGCWCIAGLGRSCSHAASILWKVKLSHTSLLFIIHDNVFQWLCC